MTEKSTQFQGLKKLVDINSVLDKLAHEQGIIYSTMEPDELQKGSIPTGILSFDLMSGGGLAPGRMSYFYGPTGSGKSTVLFHGIKSALSQSVMVDAKDHEASFDPAYLRNIGIIFEDVVGRRNKKGVWEVEPQMRYSRGKTAENTFINMNAILRHLPDKIQLWDPKEEVYRYFLIGNDYAYKPTWASINAGLKADKVQEVEDYKPQMMFVTDSLKAMLPNAQDEDPDKEPIAMLARCFAKMFPLVKGALGQKHCVWAVTNHVTINPMAFMQNPENEPGGSAVQFYPDFKMRLQTKRTQKAINDGVEPTVSGGGEDRYLPGTAKILKNKFGPSFRSCDYRIWVDSAGTPGMGIDPVFDTFQFLQMTQLIEKAGGKKDDPLYKIMIDGFSDSVLTWAQFKKMVLTDDQNRLRNHCQGIITDGSASERYYEFLKDGGFDAKAKKPKKEADEADDAVEEAEENETVV